MTPKLTQEQQEAIEERKGGPVRVQGTDAAWYVLLSVDNYRALLGDKPEEQETAEAVEGIRAGLDAVREGRTRPFIEALDDLGRKHEAQG